MPADRLTLLALRALELNPDLTQRQLARELGVLPTGCAGKLFPRLRLDRA